MGKKSGYSIVEMLAVLSMIVLFLGLVLPNFNKYMDQTRVQEVFNLMIEQSASINRINQFQSCTKVPNENDSVLINNGRLVISGTYTSNYPDCPIGCNLEFTFKDAGVSSNLKSKKITAILLNDGSLSKINNKTTVLDDFLPNSFKNKIGYLGNTCQ